MVDKANRQTNAFLWKGDGPEKVSGGHCLVKWPVSRPKNLGGLGITDLERFARAPRLRRMWYTEEYGEGMHTV